MFRKPIFFISILVLLLFCSIQNVIAADPNWKEKQEALFKQTGLEPGEKITKKDTDRIKDLVPPHIVEYLERGWIDMNIGEFAFDPQPDDEWINAGQKNAGKYKLDAKENLVEVTTNKPPLYVYGIPFPDLDIQSDSNGAIKYMYNRMLSMDRVGHTKHPFSLEWVGANGFERVLANSWNKFLYWSRPKGPISNPKRYRDKQITAVTSPYNLAGTAQLTFRKTDGTPDEVYVYVPAIRRVKRMSGANRSDPYMGTEFTIDDAYGWAGLETTMKWRVIGEKIGLLCIEKWAASNLNKMNELPDGTWITKPGRPPASVGWEVDGWKGAKWAPAATVWIPRHFIIIEAIPKNHYYNGSKFEYWIDKDLYAVNHKIMWNKAGQRWKISLLFPEFMEWMGKRTISYPSHTFYDEKTKHATIGRSDGLVMGYEMFYRFNCPDTPGDYTLGKFHLISK